MGLAVPTPGQASGPKPTTAGLSLEEELEIACVDALRGDPAGRQLAGRLERVCRTILRNHGIREAQVQVRSDLGGTAVHIALPPNRKRVRNLVVRLG